MPIAEGLILNVAQSVLKKWIAEGVSEGELPIPAVLAEGIEQLQKGGLLPDLGDIAADPEKLIETVISAVKKFQRISGSSSFDGVLRKPLLNWLNAAPLCPLDQNHDESKVKPLPTTAPGAELYTIRYFIDPSMESAIGGKYTSDLIAEAWQMWMELCKYLEVTWVRSPEEANLIVAMQRIDGNGGILGRAPVCGPGNFNGGKVIMDHSELWDANLFRAAICHEFGHVLGLGHSSSSGDLMSPIIEQGVIAPRPNDVQRIQRIYGKSDILPPPPGGRKLFR